MKLINLLIVAGVVSLIVGCTANRKMHAKGEKYSKLQVYGGYHPQEVGLGFRKIFPELNTCHAEHNTPRGRLVVQYIIDSGDGRTRDIKTIKDGRVINNPPFEACVISAVSKLKYDKLVEGNNSKVIYPLSFPLVYQGRPD